MRYDPEAHSITFLETPPAESEYKCPNCGKTVRNDRWAYTCDCSFRLFKTVSKNHKAQTKKQLDNFFAKGDTGEIQGLEGSSGRTFSASLVLPEDRIERVPDLSSRIEGNRRVKTIRYI